MTPQPPTKEGYTFVGWDKDYSSVTENMMIQARYVETPPSILSASTVRNMNIASMLKDGNKSSIAIKSVEDRTEDGAVHNYTALNEKPKTQQEELSNAGSRKITILLAGCITCFISTFIAFVLYTKKHKDDDVK
jgi:uncharacterized repeat protein (TIGR02543 family)